MRRLSLMVIRQTQAQRGDAGSLKYAAEFNLTLPFAIPLRKYDEREVLATLEQSSNDRIVFRIRRFNRARKFQDVVFQVILRTRLARVKRRAILQRKRDVVL